MKNLFTNFTYQLQAKQYVSKTILGVFGLFLFMSACNKDENTNSTPIVDNTALYKVLPVFESEATFTRAANVWQRFQLLGGHILGGHTQPMAAFAPTTGQYLFPGTEAWEDWRDVALRYFYNQNVMPNWIKYTTSSSATNLLKGIAYVLKVQAAHALVDQLGPIPYTKIKALTDTAVDFDASETIYKAMFEELNTAETLLNQATADATITSYDKIYAGDLAKWKKYLNSLRLRLAMRVRFADATLAKTNGEKALANGVFASDADQAILTTKGIEREESLHEDTHPFANVTNVYASVDQNIAQADFAMHLKGYQDPRLFQMYETIDRTTGWNNLTGIVPGIRIGLEDYVHQNGYAKLVGKTQKFKGQFYEYMVLSYAEVCFLKAEAALAGWAGAGTAKTNYEEGVKANMKYWGITDAAAITTYLAGTTNPSKHVDYKGTTALDADSINLVSVSYDAATTDEQRLQKIITQKWIALYPDGQEAWSEQRRTGYPKLLPSGDATAAAADAAYNTGGKTGQRAVRRLPYATGATHVFGKNNAIKAKYNAAISGLSELGGQNDYKGKIWWDKR